MAEGVWRTINGARVFIKSGQSLESAMADAGFKTGPNGTPKTEGHGEYSENEFLSMLVKKYFAGDKQLFPNADDADLKESLEKLSTLKREDFDSYSDYMDAVSPYVNYVRGQGMPYNMVRFTYGANEDGYGTSPNGRMNFDAKYGISSFIDSNPDVHYNGGTLYRGIQLNNAGYKELIEAANSGNLISQNGLSSWSPKQSTAELFTKYSLGPKGRNRRVIFVEDSTPIKRAMYMGVNRQQSEVVYSGSVSFQPLSVKIDGDITYINVKEVR